jgi:hypothetical protein
MHHSLSRGHHLPVPCGFVLAALPSVVAEPVPGQRHAIVILLIFAEETGQHEEPVAADLHATSAG